MAKDPVLPIQRPRQLAFSSKVDRAPNSRTVPLVGHIKDSPLGGALIKLWRVCTTTLDGSLSETFKLVSSDDSDGVSSMSGKSKKPAVNGDGDSFLDAVVVDHEDYSEEKPGLHPHQSDSSQRSGQGGSNSTVPGLNKLYSSGLDYEAHYQGGFKSWIRNIMWPRIVDFFEPRLPEHEEEFQTLTWHSIKFTTFAATLYLVLNWVLYLILNNDSTKHTIYAKAVYWGGLSFFTLPTPFMVAFDMPRKSPVLFQTWFCIAVWYCAFSEVIQMRVCHFFNPQLKFQCFGKDFLAMNYYATGLPALMMFIISKRLYNFIAQFAFFILLCTLVLPVQGIYARNVVSFAIFSIFIQGLHYTIEDARRKMFLLALQLKQAYRSKHKARLAESKASFMKRRFANYIFHEVRVPLNNAVLAFQLLQSSNAFKEGYAKSTEIYALEQGLKMMKTVLNDVLDFEKMDSGHFETIARPFPLHHSIRAILDQVEVQTGARRLVLQRALDERIDNAALTLEPGRVEEPEGLWVLGSELRLHQVLTNLATNAVKYTPEGGGSVSISTEFLGLTTREELPEAPPDIDEGQDGPIQPTVQRTGSGTILTQCLTFRLVVHDSGPGIKPSDLVEDRLFQPFVQTTVGQSSGSGTGLGLAIVKQIIRLSGGRLGVTSRRGEGSKFWIELSYPIASAAEVQAAREANTLHFTPRAYGAHKEKSHDRDYMSRSLVAPSPPSHDRLPPGFAAAVAATQQSPAPLHVPLPPGYPNYDSESDQTKVGGTPPATVVPSPPPLDSPPPPSPIFATTAPMTLTPISVVGSTVEPKIAVLVVDDDALTRALSSKLLTKLGCTVSTAKDGRECVDMVLGAAPHTYDLICLDNFMPVMTGEEAIKEIRASDRDDFVVGCTGNALTEDQDSYREAGADEVVVKPVMIHDFKRLIAIAQQRRLERRERSILSSPALAPQPAPTAPS